jgi:hypothetical protein
VRTTAARAVVGLAVFFAFAFATLCGPRAELARPAAVAIAAARTVGHLHSGTLSPHPTKGPSVAHAIKRGADRVGPAHSLGPALSGELGELTIGAAQLSSILGGCIDADGFRNLLAHAQHRSRAPPRFV